ncbi:tetraacyldisaccharide 4'-kinase [Comamonas sp. NLF-1-9]|uniref:tetraacyldisaccharide 4'-kinase n=1 Tax=Comamonas sp. NLF-1-9 TaxID=2853163 RepID=UPI001C477142|nr:tetraacyldisaccharide 4'-kinase [Comamonas sp. NLF-1-9]QXL85191.1 tetraacyldisaccharide 4'-kinase [Comamonas sp. NLF-1-9]
MAQRLRRAWQHKGALARLLWPLSLLYRALTALRRALHRRGWLRRSTLGVPVVVVGNVVAGGAGKTPVVIALVQHLQARGWRPGIVSRGHGRRTRDCREVRATSAPAEVGDEPLLLARRTGVPVFVAARRADAGRALLAAHPDCNILVCDDGLQHLALARKLEICVFSETGVGNGWLLPAGPLREAWPRPVDALLYHGAPPVPAGSAPAFALRRTLAPCVVNAAGEQLPLQRLRGQPLHALAGVAAPEAFFAMLRARGLTLERTESLPDHFAFDSWQRPSGKGLILICTEKDAVKLWRLHPEAWAAPLQVELDPAFFAWLDARLAPLSSTPAGESHGPETA